MSAEFIMTTVGFALVLAGFVLSFTATAFDSGMEWSLPLLVAGLVLLVAPLLHTYVF